MTEGQTERYVVNWSEQQKCFHVETEEEMVIRNRDNFDHCTSVDFVPLAFASSSEEASTIVASYREKRDIPLLQDQIPETGI
jgi:hypothetical protein